MAMLLATIVDAGPAAAAAAAWSAALALHRAARLTLGAGPTLLPGPRCMADSTSLAPRAESVAGALRLAAAVPATLV